MNQIPCRKFDIKIEKNNPDGTKTPIIYKDLSRTDKTNLYIKTLDVFDLLLEIDDCREAKSVIEFIQAM